MDRCDRCGMPFTREREGSWLYCPRCAERFADRIKRRLSPADDDLPLGQAVRDQEMRDRAAEEYRRKRATKDRRAA